MKKIFLIGMLCMSLIQSFACDICGCSSGNYYLGPFPQFRKHFLVSGIPFEALTARLQTMRLNTVKIFIKL